MDPAIEAAAQARQAAAREAARQAAQAKAAAEAAAFEHKRREEAQERARLELEAERSARAAADAREAAEAARAQEAAAAARERSESLARAEKARKAAAVAEAESRRLHEEAVALQRRHEREARERERAARVKATLSAALAAVYLRRWRRWAKQSCAQRREREYSERIAAAMRMSLPAPMFAAAPAARAPVPAALSLDRRVAVAPSLRELAWSPVDLAELLLPYMPPELLGHVKLGVVVDTEHIERSGSWLLSKLWPQALLGQQEAVFRVSGTLTVCLERFASFAELFAVQDLQAAVGLSHDYAPGTATVPTLLLHSRLSSVPVKEARVKNVVVVVDAGLSELHVPFATAPLCRGLRWLASNIDAPPAVERVSLGELFEAAASAAVDFCYETGADMENMPGGAALKPGVFVRVLSRSMEVIVAAVGDVLADLDDVAWPAAGFAAAFEQSAAVLPDALWWNAESVCARLSREAIDPFDAVCQGASSAVELIDGLLAGNHSVSFGRLALDTRGLVSRLAPHRVLENMVALCSVWLDERVAPLALPDVARVSARLRAQGAAQLEGLVSAPKAPLKRARELPLQEVEEHAPSKRRHVAGRFHDEASDERESASSFEHFLQAQLL